MNRVPPPVPLRPHNLQLEGLRGLAASMVIYCHVFAPAPEIDPAYSPSARFWTFETGQGAVALFFVISGFVIGLTNNRPWSAENARDYLWRRFIRLVPLYLLAIAFSVAVRPVDPPATIAGNLVFLETAMPYGSWHVPLLAANSNLWSLNYEILYYLLFLAVWRWRIPIPRLIGAGAVAAAVGYFRPDLLPPFLASYATGWVFWLAGLWLAWAASVLSPAEKRGPWPALLVLFVVTWKMKMLFSLLRRAGISQAGDAGPISLIDLDFLPICVVLVALTTGRTGRYFAATCNACLLAPLAYCGWRIFRHTLGAEPDDAIYAALASAAAVFWWWRPSPDWFSRISIGGFLCYGIYVFQRPVQWLVRDSWPAASGRWATFLVRATLTIALTFTVAWLAERRVQPWLRRRAERWRRRIPATA